MFQDYWIGSDSNYTLVLKTSKQYLTAETQMILVYCIEFWFFAKKWHKIELSLCCVKIPELIALGEAKLNSGNNQQVGLEFITFYMLILKLMLVQ